MEILARISMLQGNNITCQNVDWNAYLDYFSTPSTENANDVSWMVRNKNDRPVMLDKTYLFPLTHSFTAR